MAVPYPGSKDISGTGRVLGRVVVLLANGGLCMALEASAILRVREGRRGDGGTLCLVEWAQAEAVMETEVLTPFAEVVRLWAEALG